MLRICQFLLALALLGLTAAGCTTVIQPPQESFALRVVTTGLAHPWDIVYGPDGYLWVTERTGHRVTRVNPADGSTQVAITIDEVHSSAPRESRQDGLLGMALHPELLEGTGNDYVYVAYTYDLDPGEAVERRVKIRRYAYDTASQTLGEPLDLLTDLPGSTDHNSGRLLFGQDQKLYYTIGEQGNNQFRRFCLPILAQELPTAAEVSASDWSRYPGKVLRLNLDGSIPSDNPTLAGVQSHVYTYGHRNIQGLAAGPQGQLYGAEHGPKTDDEINLLEAGRNYGWPHVAGYQDDQAYRYANWSAAENCESLEYSDFEIPESVPQQLESEWSHPDFTPPLHTFGTVETGYNFQIPECEGNYFMCWPTVAPSGLEVYIERAEGVPGWATSLLIPALKTGSVYRIALSADGRTVQGEAIPYFKTTNRYRDVAVSPDGRSFYVITDNDNVTQDESGLPTEALDHPGAILEFSYTGGE
jgi:PQQ-dependent dehydrogenase (s-GDH family)